MIPITILMIIIDVGRLRGWKIWDLLGFLIKPMIRKTETLGDFTGATYILTSSCLVIALFSTPVAVTALAFIIAGDPPSALIGRRYGRHRYKSKSLEGSLCFLAAALIVAAVAPEIPAMAAYTGAVVATFTEAVSDQVDDNVTVPLVSGLVMNLIIRIMA